jgi:hypothetical protein
MLRVLATAVFTFSLAAARAEQHAIVEVETGFLIGTVGEGKWTEGEIAHRHVKGGEQYRLYSLTERLGTAIGGKPKSAGEPCVDVQVVALQPKPAEAVVAIAGDWNALPRVPKVQDTKQPTYIAAVRTFLIGKGIRDPKVKITQVLRIDLEGDGEDEVLLSGTNYFNPPDDPDSAPSSAPAGSYSFVILRRVVAGKVQTQLIAGDFFPKGKTLNAPARYRIAAVLDCDGDGKMEIVVDGGYYEGGWTTIHRCTPRKAETLLTAACGA